MVILVGSAFRMNTEEDDADDDLIPEWLWAGCSSEAGTVRVVKEVVLVVKDDTVKASVHVDE